ncbi:MAG: response regulator transcription factor [Anaerolineae bacterium]|nr:response regulator transcription factor [Anaerolineae bacterium]
METRTITVLLIDDHSAIHHLVAALLETASDIRLVAQGSSGLDALPLYAQHQPDVVLMDVIMPGMDGITATQKLLAAHPEARILVLSGFQDDDSVHAMLQAGAVGYVLKVTLSNDLINGIRAAASGSTLLSAQVAQSVLHPTRPEAANPHNLTEREVEVLRLISKGKSNKEIAQALTISVSTVKYHLTNVMEKMQVETRSEAVAQAFRDGLL